MALSQLGEPPPSFLLPSLHTQACPRLGCELLLPMHSSLVNHARAAVVLSLHWTPLLVCPCVVGSGDCGRLEKHPSNFYIVDQALVTYV